MTELEIAEMNKSWDEALNSVLRGKDHANDKLEDQHIKTSLQMKRETAPVIPRGLLRDEITFLRESMPKEQFTGWLLGNVQLNMQRWYRPWGTLADLETAYLYMQLAIENEKVGGGKG